MLHPLRTLLLTSGLCALCSSAHAQTAAPASALSRLAVQGNLGTGLHYDRDSSTLFPEDSPHPAADAQIEPRRRFATLGFEVSYAIGAFIGPYLSVSFFVQALVDTKVGLVDYFRPRIQDEVLFGPQLSVYPLGGHVGPYLQLRPLYAALDPTGYGLSGAAGYLWPVGKGGALGLGVDVTSVWYKWTDQGDAGEYHNRSQLLRPALVASIATR